MRCRDHIALTLPSFLLRLVLAITFLWAGTAKIVGTTTIEGDSAARLSNLGVSFITPASPNDALPDDLINPLPDTTPETTPEAATPELPEPDQTPPSTDPLPESSEEPPAVSTLPYTLHQAANISSPAVGSDFPEPVTIKRVYKIALLLDYSISPGLTADSQPITPTMPTWLGAGSMPVYAAWATAITELLAGLLLLLGLLTRISALSICIVMLVAMWMTQIGPAALQSNNALLGFIPHVDDPWSPAAYQSFLWQLSLIAMSISVFFLGAGPLSLDRAFFRPGRRDPYVSGEPTKQPKHHPEPPHERSAFDRSSPSSTTPPSLPDTPNPTP